MRYRHFGRLIYSSVFLCETSGVGVVSEEVRCKLIRECL